MLKIPIVEIFGKFGTDKKGRPRTEGCLQGEGKFSGIPSVFVRSFGCNLKCRFGCTDDIELGDSYERQIRNFPIAFPNLKLEEILSFPVCCDTPYSIWPEYRKYSTMYTAEELAEEIAYNYCDYFGDIHLVITGGEPLLPGYQDIWVETLRILMEKNQLKYVTFETNGSYELNNNMVNFIKWQTQINVNFSISPKLSSAGYPNLSKVNKNAYLSYLAANLHRTDKLWFKFVISSREDLKEINEISTYNIPIYLMPVGGTKEELEKNEKLVYKLCCEKGYRYSPRLQVSVMNNGIGI